MTDNRNDASLTENRELSDRPAGVHTAYFYYLKVEGETITISTYEKFRNAPALDSARRVAIDLIGNHLANDPERIYRGNDFDDIERRRKGYFIVALEGASFEAGNRSPITFQCDRASEPESVDNDGRHTFTPLGTFDLEVSGTAVSVAAYLSRAQSFIRPDDLNPGESEHYKITINAVERIDPLYSDSGGTNMGPPVPPPVVTIGTPPE